MFGRTRILIVVGVAAVTWSLWKTRNIACFDHVYPDDPTSVVYQISCWINSLADLQKAKIQQDKHSITRQFLQRVFMLGSIERTGVG